MQTAETLRAAVDAAKITATANFKRDWGADLPAVIAALRQTIPGSASPQDAARNARALLAA